MKVAMITGSSKGIGRAIALKLHAEGFEIIVTYFKDEAAGKKVFSEIKEQGLLLQLDSGNEASVLKAQKEVAAKYDHLDVLVVSGMQDAPKSFKDTTPEEWNFVISNKLTGSFLVPKYFYLLLKKAEAPNIILNTSSVDERPFVGAVAYSAATAGVTNLMKSLALELAPEGFRVNAIGPGTIRTDNWKGVGLEDDQLWQDLSNKNPMRRVPQPEDVADAVSYLISDKAKFINGNIIYVDGGNRWH